MKIKRQVFLLGCTSFLNDLSSQMIIPILPFFIAILGGGPIAIGLIGAGRDGVASVMKFLGGYIADRFGNIRPLLFTGYTIAQIGKILFAFAGTPAQVFGIATLERFGKGLRAAPKDIVIAEDMGEAKGKGFGFHQMMDRLGAVAGAAFVLFLLTYYLTDYRTIMIIAGCIGFCSLIPLFFLNPPKPREVKNPRSLPSWSKLGLPLRKFIAVSAVFAIANFTYMFFILKVGDVYGMDSKGITLALLLYIFFTLVQSIFSLPAGILSDRYGRKKALGLGYIIFSLTCLGFASANSMMMFTALFALYGIANALIAPSEKAIISDLSGKDNKGSALGAYYALTGILFVPGGILAGVLWTIHPGYTFLMGAGVALVAMIGLFTVGSPDTKIAK